MSNLRRFLPAFILCPVLPLLAAPQPAGSPATPATAPGADVTQSPAAPAAATRPAGPTSVPATDWVDAVKNPVPWFKWGSDLRLRWEYLDNAFTLDRHTPNNEWNFQRVRPRLWSTVAPVPEVEFNVRLTWEDRHWCAPHPQEEWDNKNALFDIFNLKLKVPDLPVTTTIGRQEIILGDGWLVLEGTPLDGSRTIFFDAWRTTIDLKPVQSTLDLIYVYQFSKADQWLPVFCNDGDRLIEQDERAAIVYLTNKSIPKTQIDGYVIYKRDERVLPNGDQGDIYTVGSRVARELTKHVTARSEGAYQFGRRNGADLSAFGANNRLSYLFKDPWKNQLKLNYEFLSGDDPDNERNTAFDPLWGRWPQWSEMYIYTWATETRVSEATNLHRFGPGWQIEPTEKLTILADYMLLWADENTYAGRPGFSESERFRGQLITAIAKYRFNRFWSGHLMGEYFVPGNYYAVPRDDSAFYLRAEMVFTF